MHKHFFTFEKLVNGRRTGIYHDVIVALPRKAQTEARQIAEQEMAEWREGYYRLVQDKVAEQRAEHFPKVDYQFVGVC